MKDENEIVKKVGRSENQTDYFGSANSINKILPAEPIDEEWRRSEKWKF